MASVQETEIMKFGSKKMNKKSRLKISMNIFLSMQWGPAPSPFEVSRKTPTNFQWVWLRPWFPTFVSSLGWDMVRGSAGRELLLMGLEQRLWMQWGRKVRDEVIYHTNSIIHGNMSTGNGAMLVANLLVCYLTAVHNYSPLKTIWSVT